MKRSAPGAGPYKVDQLRDDDRCELTKGHPVYVAPTGSDGARGALVGGHVIDTDPRVESACLDGGFALDERTLRAPDIAVGDLPDKPGWIRGAPLLAVEYASTGQDEAQLQLKIKELLGAGTRYVWVVRLLGIRRVEIYEPEKPMRVANMGEELLAPGVLQNPIPVEAMFDRSTAHDITLRNLLQRRGYQDLEAVRDEGRRQGQEGGLRDALRAILSARGITLDPSEAGRLNSCRDIQLLERWIGRAATARTMAEVFG